MLKSRTKTFAFAIISALLSTTAVAGQAQAETFSIGGKALNTNSQFRRIDGEPRMSIWDLVRNDPDQDFQRLQGNRGGVLLRHRTTGKCLNAYRRWNGAEFNVWTCNPNDSDQNWQINSLGGQAVQLRLAGTNFCIDTPTRTNGGKVHLWSCDSNNPNQRWTVSTTQLPQIPPSAQRILDAVKRVNPEVNYRFDGSYTYCNWFAGDVLQLLGVPVPRVNSTASWNYYNSVVFDRQQKPFLAEHFHRFFQAGGNGQWKLVDAATAVNRANQGRIVVATADVPPGGRDGHIAIVIPGGSGTNVRIAQAGLRNGSNLSVKEGFGDRTPSYFEYIGPR
ncbi:RICIN domain-containing protein [Alkalinema sp. FACHB-956]|uniref:RICIN domain-containing protein n=1 Tax=Alkalinema sp. FACHB-956 TaxID=2692768 RepID=UPI00168803FB|nr:RICIN domain-containing protein [Alkalinema sp. FACHB-956]MBD2329173.1 ricin-type beta-trefoil lectin domain protein [Alkalinema sp. FACHB-956]